MAAYKRKIKLIKPTMQVRLTMIFVGLSALSLLLQFILFMTTMTRVALDLPSDGSVLLDEMNRTLLMILGTSFLIFLPLTFLVGVLTTFRVAGPLYRFEKYFEQIIRGEDVGPCKIRKGDKLQDFCDLLNDAVTTLKEERGSRAGGDAGGGEEEEDGGQVAA